MNLSTLACTCLAIALCGWQATPAPEEVALAWELEVGKHSLVELSTAAITDSVTGGQETTEKLTQGGAFLAEVTKVSSEGNMSLSFKPERYVSKQNTE
jgi:hypothetical protein